MKWQNKQKKITFSDVLASEMPQTLDQVDKRWEFLKMENCKIEEKKDLLNTVMSFIILILTMIILVAMFSIQVCST